MKKIIMLFMLFVAIFCSTKSYAQAAQLDDYLANNKVDTTSMTSDCENQGFENGSNFSWNQYHAGYGYFGGNSLDIIGIAYRYKWGIKSTGNASAEIQNQTSACKYYYSCGGDSTVIDNRPNGSNYPIYNSSGYLQKNQIHHNIVTSGSDPIVPILNRTHSGNNALRLGNAASFMGFEFIEKKFVVTTSNSIFSFWYASVMSNPSHGPGQDQYFGVNVFEENATILTDITNTTGGISVNVGSGTNTCFSSDLFSTAYARNKFCDPSLAMPGGIKYRDWSYVSFNLASKIGKTIVIRMWTRDCMHCGDFAYAYLDDFCSTADSSNPTGSISLGNKDSCGIGKICIDYSLPQNATTTGSTILHLNIYQGGSLITTLNSPTLTIGTSYCFPINAALLATLTSGTHFDYSVKGDFFIGTTSLASQYLGYTGSGQDLITNNDYAIQCRSQCQCGQWGSIVYYLNGVKDKFLCNNSNIINANQGDIFTLTPSYTCVGATVAQACNAIIKYDIYFPNGGVLLNVNNIKDKVIDSCGDIRIVMKPTCNGVACPPCEFILRVNCCKCLQEIKPLLVWFTGIGTGTRNEMPIKCGETYTNKLECFQPYLLQVPNPCGANCPADSMITTIQGPSGPPLISYSVGSTSLIANQVGTYTVTIKVKCGGKWCKECKFKFIQTKNCEPPCDNCTNKVSFEFDSGASSIDVQTNPTASTVNATFVLGGGADTYTNVRANVVDFQITSDNPACLQCYNTPNQWGSILSGSIPGFTPAVTSYPSVSAANANNNPREIVFNTTTPTAIPMGTILNLSIKIPGVNPLSCCCIKVVLYVKITYRNNKCEECTKIVRVGLTQCPPNNTDPATGNTGTSFDPDGGHPQFRMHTPSNEDAKILNAAPSNKKIND
jgi:hypothetical protein